MDFTLKERRAFPMVNNFGKDWKIPPHLLPSPVIHSALISTRIKAQGSYSCSKSCFYVYWRVSALSSNNLLLFYRNTPYKWHCIMVLLPPPHFSLHDDLIITHRHLTIFALQDRTAGQWYYERHWRQSYYRAVCAEGRIQILRWSCGTDQKSKP